MEHKQITSDRGVTHYWITRHETCHQKAIILTHGLTADHTMFDKQVAYFSKAYTVITWDVPLHGLSRPYEDFSYRHTAEELRMILQIEGIEKVVLVGMSMGGYPCQEFMAQYPDQVQAFIALDTTPFGTAYYSKSDLWWLRQVAPMARWFPDSMLRKSMAKSVSRTREAYEMMMKMLAPFTKAEIIEQMEVAYGVFARENRDITITCPVLILLGEFDKTGKVARYCEAWAEKTGYPLHIIKDASHFSNGDQPEQVNEVIERFIKGIL
ncbi:MAG: alpha/beta fold hydrolase [Cellulosilyticaceae bacterium]